MFARLNITRTKVEDDQGVRQHGAVATSRLGAAAQPDRFIVKMEHLVVQNDVEDAIDVARLYGWAPRGQPIVEFVRKLGNKRRYGKICKFLGNSLLVSSCHTS